MKRPGSIALFLIALLGIGVATPSYLRAAPVASVQVEAERPEIDALLMETALMLRGQDSGLGMVSFSPSAASNLRGRAQHGAQIAGQWLGFYRLWSATLCAGAVCRKQGKYRSCRDWCSVGVYRRIIAAG